MAELFGALWWVITWLFSIAWGVVWFVLSDLISTLVWIGILVWLVLAARYRSFYGGALAMLRYGRHGARLLWGWIRKRPVDAAPIRGTDAVVRQIVRRRPPFGTVSLSGQMTALLIFMLMLRAVLPA